MQQAVERGILECGENHSSPDKARPVVNAPILDARMVPSRQAAGSASSRRPFTPWLVRVCLIVGSILWAAAGRLSGGSQPAGRTSIDSGQGAATSPRSADPDDPAQADRYAGRVIGPDGRPCAGARLYLVDADTIKEKPLASVRALTDDSGRFQFSAPDMTDLAFDGLPVRCAGLLVAIANGHGLDWVLTLRPKATEWTLKLTRDVPIHGRLLDQHGEPFAGVSVNVTSLSVPHQGNLDHYLRFRPGGFLSEGYHHEKHLYRPSFVPGVTAVAITDRDGRFRLAGLGAERVAALNFRGADVREWNIAAMTREAPDFKPKDLPGQPGRITYGAGFTLQLKRTPSRTITGIVRDKQTGEPLPDMRVGTWDIPKERGDLPATDANGGFALTGISPDFKGFTILTAPPPGSLHFRAKSAVPDSGDVVIECARGIPYRLKLVDEGGQPVDAEVYYYPVVPNPNIARMLPGNPGSEVFPLSRAKRQSDGTYAGAVLPGPGAVFVETPRRAGYRPAFVDAKAFFAPGKNDWKPEDENTLYGNHEIIFTDGVWLRQQAAAAIVLVNPPADSPRLDLAAVVVRDRPRQVTLIDAEGTPVAGVQAHGTTYYPWNQDTHLRVASFPMRGLHPDRPQPIVFVHEAKKLVGFLMARGDGDSSYTVRLQPWGTIKGRLVDESGQPLVQTRVTCSCERTFPSPDDPSHGIMPLQPHPSETGADGRFTLEPVMPGLACTIRALPYLGGLPAAPIEIKNVKVVSGHVRDLGDIQFKTKPDHP
jgi:hypothetical protein